MIKIRIKDRPNSMQEQWLTKHIGPRMHWMSKSIGGQGWIAKEEVNVEKQEDGTPLVRYDWYLTFEDDKMATYYTLMFSS